MHKDWQKTTQDLSALMQDIGKDIPDVAKGFNQMAKGANKDGVLSHKYKELMALAIGISVRCDGCIAFHAKAVAELGATREEVMEMLGVCMYMGGGPAFTYAAQALEAFDSFASQD
ncbi:MULTISPECIES: carboxymuconolactone decarboxylase family protein [Halomonadaceae]|uniref:Carboxymuconolactone decarboxylase family protein n=2 Tax=Vreelandella TaxID=3137766 RepID=A0A7Z0LQC8_9GAMM|nr:MULTISPECIES: carboxymuconolactone decarboxylase family protein [Halomonas]NYS76602.1 carboxymuconolactone decarboxylase family protein [Halomonas glaciei]|tara:strand:+ start:215 stop:562 length:348 start_codon:yes stop_codon:yes gene_type:complete